MLEREAERLLCPPPRFSGRLLASFVKYFLRKGLPMCTTAMPVIFRNVIYVIPMSVDKYAHLYEGATS